MGLVASVSFTVRILIFVQTEKQISDIRLLFLFLL